MYQNLDKTRVNFTRHHLTTNAYLSGKYTGPFAGTITAEQSLLEQQRFFLLSFCVVYAVHGVFYTLTEQLFLGGQRLGSWSVPCVLSNFSSSIVPALYVSEDVFRQDLIADAVCILLFNIFFYLCIRLKLFSCGQITSGLIQFLWFSPKYLDLSHVFFFLAVNNMIS